MSDNRPTELPTWATDTGTRVEPSAAKKQIGFVQGERVTAKTLNYLLANPAEWAEHLARLAGAVRVGTLSNPVATALSTATAAEIRLAVVGQYMIHIFELPAGNGNWSWSDDWGQTWTLQSGFGVSTQVANGNYRSCAISEAGGHAIAIDVQAGNTSTSGLAWSWADLATMTWSTVVRNVTITVGTLAGRGVVVGEALGNPSFGMVLRSNNTFAHIRADDTADLNSSTGWNQETMTGSAANTQNDLAYGVQPDGAKIWAVAENSATVRYAPEASVNSTWSTSTVGSGTDAVLSIVHNGRYWFVTRGSGTGARVWRNEDLSTSWTLLEHTRDMLPDPASRWELGADPRSGAILLMDATSASSKVYASADHGETWVPMLDMASDFNIWVNDFPVIDPKTGKWWWADHDVPATDDWSVRCSL